MNELEISKIDTSEAKDVWSSDTASIELYLSLAVALPFP